MRKRRLQVRLSDRTHVLLDQMTLAPGTTKSAIVEDALRAYIDPDSDPTREELLLKRMDQFDIRQGAIERDLALCTETLAQYILYWLTHTHPIPDGERDAARAVGKRRFNEFLQNVAETVGAAS